MGRQRLKSSRKENILDGFGNDQFINQMLQNNAASSTGDALPDLQGLDDLGMDTTDIKPSINPLNNPGTPGKLSHSLL